MDEQHQSDHGEDVWHEPDTDTDPSTNEDSFVTDDELEALSDEVKVLHGGDLKVASQKLLEEKTLSAVQSIAKLAVHGTAERVRLDASKYLVDRVLGPLSKLAPEINEEETHLGRLLKEAGFGEK